MHYYTDEDKAVIITAYQSNLERYQIADNLKITTSSLRYFLRLWNVPVRKAVRQAKVLTDDDYATFEKLREIAKNRVDKETSRSCRCTGKKNAPIKCKGTMFLQEQREQYYCCTCGATKPLCRPDYHYFGK